MFCPALLERNNTYTVFSLNQECFPGQNFSCLANNYLQSSEVMNIHDSFGGISQSDTCPSSLKATKVGHA